jgi:hypothetical protein
MNGFVIRQNWDGSVLPVPMSWLIGYCIRSYSGTGDVAAYNGNVSSDESHGIIERQADTLASALLMPLPQIKKCFYRIRIGRTDEQLIAEMANIFEVSKQAMQIRLKSRNLI